MADKFNWDDYPEAIDPSEEEFTALESAGQGALDVGSLGFSDEAIGGAKALMESLQGKLGDKELAKRYQELRDIERDKQRLAAEQNPLSYGAGGLAGGIAGAALGGAALGAVGVGGRALSAGRLIAQGAAEGGLAGVGASETEFAGAEDKLAAAGEIGEEAASSAAMGATVAGALGVALPKVARSIADTDYGQKLASGFRKGQEGITTYGRKAREALGSDIENTARQASTITNKYLKRVGTEIGDIYDNPNSFKSDTFNIEGLMGDLKSKLSDAAVPDEDLTRLGNRLSKLKSSTESRGFKALIEAEMQAAEQAGSPLNIKQAADIVSSKLKAGDPAVLDTIQNLDIVDLRKLKSIIAEESKHLSGPEAGKVKGTLGHILKDFGDKVDDAAKRDLLTEEAAARLNQLNSQYSSAKNIAGSFGSEGLSREEAAKTVSRLVKGAESEPANAAVRVETKELLEKMGKLDPKFQSAMQKRLEDLSERNVLAGGKHSSFRLGHVGGPLEQVAGVAGNVAGKVSRSVSKAIEPMKVSRGLQALGVESLASLAKSIEDKAPEMAAKLVQATTKDRVGRAASLFALSQSPEFRNIFNNAPEDEEE